MRVIIAALAAALFIGLSTHSSQAERVPCGNGAAFIAHLEKEWGEGPTALALDAGGRMIHVLTNPDTGTWSMLMTRPGGVTCLITHGSAWERIPMTGPGPATPQPDPGDPS